MFDTIDANDPMSTTAAALRGAEALAPLLRHRMPLLLSGQAGEDCAGIADLLDDSTLFERSTLAALREFLVRIEDVIDGTFVERRVWVPVRCIDGHEEYEKITVRDRDPRGDALAAIAVELETVIELAARTVALRRAAKLLGRSN